MVRWFCVNVIKSYSDERCSYLRFSIIHTVFCQSPSIPPNHPGVSINVINYKKKLALDFSLSLITLFSSVTNCDLSVCNLGLRAAFWAVSGSH